jgi:hypothetical protein
MPEMFPSEEKTDFVNPYIRLLVKDSRTAGPGLTVATIARLENINQVDVP